MVRALEQRGALRRVAGDDDGARADFEHAAALGSAWAKAEAVRREPVAQLCSHVMRKVLADAVAERAEPAASAAGERSGDKRGGDAATATSDADASKRWRQTNEMDNVADACGLD